MDQNEQAKPGVKHDEGKLRMDLILRFPRALQAIAAVGQRGLAEYAENGWEKVPNGAARYRAAQLRHQFDGCVGNGIDSKSGLPHAWHEAWNVLAWLELTLRDKEFFEDLAVLQKAVARGLRQKDAQIKDYHTNRSYCECDMCEAIRVTFPRHGALNGATEEG